MENALYDFYSLVELSSMRKRTRSLRSFVRFLILRTCTQLVNKNRTKHFPWCNLLFVYFIDTEIFEFLRSKSARHLIKCACACLGNPYISCILK